MGTLILTGKLFEEAGFFIFMSNVLVTKIICFHLAVVLIHKVFFGSTFHLAPRHSTITFEGERYFF